MGRVLAPVRLVAGESPWCPSDFQLITRGMNFRSLVYTYLVFYDSHIVHVMHAALDGVVPSFCMWS